MHYSQNFAYMTRIKYLFKMNLLVIIGLLLFLNTPCSLAQKTPFTPADALNVQTISIREMTEDGKYLIMTSGTRKDRMNTDHKRYRDPSYIADRSTIVEVMDVDAKTTWSIFNQKINLQGLTVSPDNSTVALLLYADGGYKIYLYDLAKRKLSPIKLKLKKTIASNSTLVWSPDNQNLLISLRENNWQEKADSMYQEATIGPITVYDGTRDFLKWEEIGIYSERNIPALINISTGEINELLPEGLYSSLNFSQSGDRLNYSENIPVKTVYDRKAGAKFGLFSLQLSQEKEIDTLIKFSNTRISTRWNEDNTVFAFADSGKIYTRSVFEDKAVLVSPDTTEIVKKDTVKVKFSPMQWSPDQKSVLVSSKTAYWLINTDSKQIDKVYDLPVEKEKAPDLSIIEWSPDGKYWYMTYSAKDKWERGLVKYSLDQKEFTNLYKDENLYGSWRMSKDGKRFIFSLSDGDSPNDYYMCDDTFGEPVRLTDSNPWAKDKLLTTSELIKYRDSDGKELYGILYYPVNYEEGKKYPLVCEIYETFFSNGFNTNMNIIANEGFFGFRPSVNLIEGYPGEAWIKGITSGINLLIDRGLVDPEKLGVHGTSYGGYATSLLITQTDRFAAAINISGKVNIISFLGDSPKIGTRNYAAAEVGQDRIGKSLWDAPLQYFATTAVLYADRIKTPHLLLTGEGDWNVPGVNSRELYYAMRRLGKEVMWVNYFHGGHGAGWASDEADYLDQWKRILNWYSSHFSL